MSDKNTDMTTVNTSAVASTEGSSVGKNNKNSGVLATDRANSTNNQKYSDAEVTIQARAIADPMLKEDKNFQARVIRQAGVYYMDEVTRLQSDNAARFNVFVSSVRTKSIKSLQDIAQSQASFVEEGGANDNSDDVFSELEALADNMFSSKDYDTEEV